MRNVLVAMGVALLLTSSATAADPLGLQTTVEALKARLRDQERRLNAIEEKQKTQAAPANREEIKRVVEEVCGSKAFGQPNDLRVYWKSGLRMDSLDGNFKLKLGGRFMMDWSWIDTDTDMSECLEEDFPDGVEFRRARLYASGTIYKCTDFKLQFDFADGDADLKDAYLKFKKIPVVHAVQVGHFKEPFSLEELTSSKYITFMERALPNVFAPSRNDGVVIGGPYLDQLVNFKIGMFRDADDYGLSESDGGYNVTTRLAVCPIYEDDGATVLHLGGGYSFRTPQSETRFRQRPENHFTHRLVNTDYFDATRLHVFGGELAGVLGPLSLQAEYIAANCDIEGDSDATFQGFYVQGSYFLTGEHRKYDRKKAEFGRVKPKHNWCKDGGWGAWELGARYSYLDLNDGDIQGGRLQDVTIGLNWYVNPNVRLMWNYIRFMLDETDCNEDDTAADAFMMRVQVDF